VSGAKKPTRDGPDIFPFRVLYSPTPDITGFFADVVKPQTKKSRMTVGCGGPLWFVEFLRLEAEGRRIMDSCQPAIFPTGYEAKRNLDNGKE
jgi:hypothetical protein